MFFKTYVYIDQTSLSRLNMAEEVKIVRLRRSESCGLGFSILGGAGSDFPPIVYDIVEDSPAAASGEVSQISFHPRWYTAVSERCFHCIRFGAEGVSEDTNWCGLILPVTPILFNRQILLKLGMV